MTQSSVLSSTGVTAPSLLWPFPEAGPFGSPRRALRLGLRPQSCRRRGSRRLTGLAGTVGLPWVVRFPGLVAGPLILTLAGALTGGVVLSCPVPSSVALSGGPAPVPVALSVALSLALAALSLALALSLAHGRRVRRGQRCRRRSRSGGRCGAADRGSRVFTKQCARLRPRAAAPCAVSPLRCRTLCVGQQLVGVRDVIGLSRELVAGIVVTVRVVIEGVDA